MVGLDVRIRSIDQKDVWTFLEKSFGMTESEWSKITAQKQQEEEEWRRQWKEETKLEEEQEEIKLAEKIEEYKEKYKVVTFEDIPDEDCIMIYLGTGYSKPDEYLIKKYTKGGEVKYQTMKASDSSWEKGKDKDTINNRLRKYDRTEERVKNIMNKTTVFVYKTFEGTGKVSKPSRISRPKFSRPSNTDVSTDVKIADVKIVDYSAKAIAVFGDTRPFLDKFKAIGGRYNRFLTNPKTGEKQPGWIFSKKKRGAVENAISL